MLTQEKEIIFFQIAFALQKLYETHVFEPIQNAIKIWGNYELHFNAELSETDVVKNAENIMNMRPTDSILVAKMNKDGFFSFPEETNLNKQIRTRYCEYAFEEELNEKAEEIENIEERNAFKINWREFVLSKINIDEISNIELPFSPSIEISPSMFYYINEQIVELLLGGTWKEAKEYFFDILSTYEDDEIVHDMLSGVFDLDDCYDGQKYWETIFKMENIKLYVDAVYISSTLSPQPERIIEITGSNCRNLINYHLRGFHDGIYCPLRISELIPQFIIPITVSEAIKKSVEIIESQNDFVKEASIKESLKEYNENGFFYEASIIEYFYQIYLFNTNMPSFFDKLNKKQKDQYRQIQKLNSSLHPPLTEKEQENSDYSTYFLTYFNFVNTIISSVFGDRITISDFEINRDIYKNILKSRIDNSDFNEIKQYRNKKYDNSGKRYLDLFIDIKHPIKVNLDYGMIPIFNKNTEKVLGIILKYKK
ncbi:MAG: hypothetical protein Q8O92_08990 [Candidatus Latescibacter sp.]|nr:hypothetical protein [Candidatus Latescibacter sp.]